MEFSALDFIRLTITESNAFDWMEKELPHTKSLAEYNKYAESGESILMPWLDVDIITGKVLGHEGRHRALAVYNASNSPSTPLFPIAICLRDRGYPIYYKEDQVPGEYKWVKTYMTHKNVPKVFVGQFVHREVHVDTNKIQDFWGD